MTRLRKTITLIAAALAVSFALAACGEQKIEVSAQSPNFTGASLFSERCAGCHTFRQAATHGSASNIRSRERTDGPNFNVRHECVQRVLYAIKNGGFSGAIMPANIVVGRDAEEVAAFVAKYAGTDRGGPRPEGTGDAANNYDCTSMASPGASTSGSDDSASTGADDTSAGG
ncbi:MAG TPA: hypothetical protein VGM91_22690 [Conexibacter sp.]|jgi:mono/diheme cytochrome c family protein